MNDANEGLVLALTLEFQRENNLTLSCPVYVSVFTCLLTLLQAEIANIRSEGPSMGSDNAG